MKRHPLSRDTIFRMIKAVPVIRILVLVTCAFSQTLPTFDVASIRPHPRGQPSAGRMGFNGGPDTSDPTLVRCNNCNLSMLIREAYDLGLYQLPNFTDPGVFFDISATITSGATKEQERRMLQSLLIDHFHFTAHRESKETTVYDLLSANDGAKLIPSEGSPNGTAPTSVTFDKDGFVNQSPPPPDGRIEVGRSGKSRIRGVNESTNDLARRLSRALNRPIVDRTDLAGKYDYALVFDTIAVMPPDPTSTDAETPTPIEVLLQQQLGLRLNKSKGSIEILIVDHVEKAPTEN